MEAFSALAGKVRTRELAAGEARRILDLFQRHIAEGCYGLVPIGAAEYRLARDWLGQLTGGLGTLDALHLATASTHDLPILTADRALARAAGHYGVDHELFA